MKTFLETQESNLFETTLGERGALLVLDCFDLFSHHQTLRRADWRQASLSKSANFFTFTLFSKLISHNWEFEKLEGLNIEIWEKFFFINVFPFSATLYTNQK